MSDSDTRRAAPERELSREKRIARRIRKKLRRRNLLAIGLSIGALAVALSRENRREAPAVVASSVQQASIASLDGPLVPQPTADSVPLIRMASLTDERLLDGRSSQPIALSRLSRVHVTGPLALKLNLLLLEEARSYLEQIDGYTATFHREERVGGDLTSQVMELKLRHSPFSVYMNWLEGDRGRELLFVDGENDGKMIVHPGGWKARLIPSIKLDPNGTIAMRESRHPVTEIGLLKLVDRLLERRREELPLADRLTLVLTDQAELNGFPCYRFTLTHRSPETSEYYRKSVLHLDREHGLPVSLAAWTWPEDGQDGADADVDETTLVEQYTYADLVLNPQLADRDFDRKNGDYRFRR